ncbi:solute carrier family 12 (sodium/chloride transporters), member 3 [Reticulomyxa filosa]|uniref:Solute carrier family 12 (Sodium/chloride transporters), member 3 n=1 Tax=Reticulomyxa filosa TaxID=46433 RepID=X6LA90_RETFI|nr:solute carrier family 12 (sodium/chloride transporters), member 3 [Reticulomyxa filosa]|eukprot:ETN98051.1 solute carrier family 12 (sodium/chloride transporters), member 3 [Reticulomyxa filosa]
MSISHSPAWRPSFRYYNKYTALTGFILCFVLMLATSWLYALLTFGLGIGICCYILYTKPDVYWGSALDSRAKYKANKAVLDLVDFKYHVKNYQPSFLVLCGDPESRLPLVKFVHTLRHANGTTVYSNIVIGKFHDHAASSGNNADSYLPRHLKIRAFYHKIVAPNLKNGVDALMQLNGLGKLKTNVLVMGFKNAGINSHQMLKLWTLTKKRKKIDSPMKNMWNYWEIAWLAYIHIYIYI